MMSGTLETVFLWHHLSYFHRSSRNCRGGLVVGFDWGLVGPCGWTTSAPAVSAVVEIVGIKDCRGIREILAEIDTLRENG